MSHTASRTLRITLMCVAVVTVFCFVLMATVPAGWYVAGSKPAEYDAGVDANALYSSHSSAYLKSRNPGVDGFGTLMQDFTANKYAGKRIRFSANVKAEGVRSWAGLWMRVDRQSTTVAFDNMQDRPIRGTKGWQNYAVVLNVPQDATRIFFGILLNGPGAVWLNNVKVDVVGSEVPTTGQGITGATNRADEPRNLDFTEQ